jgi:hypothetical protein
MRATLGLFLLIVVGVSPLDAAERRTPSLTGTAIREYGGDWITVPQAINNRGEIAGYAVDNDDSWVAFIRSSSGRYQSIAERGFVSDINDKGEVVGVIFPDDESGWPEGFVWSKRRGLQNLASFLPFAISPRGDMAGVCDPPGGTRQACVLRGGIVSVIPDGGEAHGINHDRTVVGTYGDNRAFRLSNRWRMTDIGRAVAEDINRHGVVAGHRWMEIPNRGERAVVTAWTRRGVRSPGDVGLGLAINDDGWVLALAWRVGADGAEEPYAFVWNSTTGARVTLRSRTGGYVSPEAINDRGVIVGTADGRPMVWTLRRSNEARNRRGAAPGDAPRRERVGVR